MWTFEINAENIIPVFSVALEKEVASKGSFESDLKDMCNTYQIIPCPHIHCIDEVIVKVQNTKIDISSWRAVMLACATIGSKINEIHVHNVKLTPSHVLELSKMLEKNGGTTILKLQYIKFIPNENSPVSFKTAFQGIISDSTNLTYLSLKGCKMGESFFDIIIPPLATNFKLLSINLSDNDLSDTFVSELFKGVRLNSTLRDISLSKNPITGTCFELIRSVIQGLEATVEDENFNKNISKLIADKNKLIKDNNKKRKKPGYKELAEFLPPKECIVKKDGKSFILNNNFKNLDFSFCDGYMDKEMVMSFASAMIANDELVLKDVEPADDINRMKLFFIQSFQDDKTREQINQFVTKSIRFFA